MARTTLTPQAGPKQYGGALLAVTMTAADVANKNQFKSTGTEFLLAQNTDAGAHNVTLTSAADPFGRTQDITESVAAGAIKVFGPIRQPGFVQVDGMIYLEAADATVKFGVVSLSE